MSILKRAVVSGKVVVSQKLLECPACGHKDVGRPRKCPACQKATMNVAYDNE
jgi:rubrerythrin